LTDTPPTGDGQEPREIPAVEEPVRTRVHPLLRSILVVGFAVVVVLSVLRVNARVRGLDDFRVDLSVAWLARAPAWLPAAERKAFAASVASAGTLPFHEEGVAESVADRLEADPRVARVLGSRRRHPDAVEVMVELRRPVALVEAGGRTVAVDREGVLLPGDYAKYPLPRIRGGSGDLPSPGKPCAKSVVEGAAVAAALPPDLVFPLGLTVVDVSGVEKGTAILLQKRTAKGEAPLSVEWGRSPASPEAELDPTAELKVAHLRLAARRFPGLKGLKSVRLAFDDLVVVPL
jgi:hypothetical protein